MDAFVEIRHHFAVLLKKQSNSRLEHGMVYFKNRIKTLVLTISIKEKEKKIK